MQTVHISFEYDVLYTHSFLTANLIHGLHHIIFKTKAVHESKHRVDT